MMSKRNKTILLLIIVLAVLVLVFGCNRARTQEDVQPQTTAQTEQTTATEGQTTEQAETTEATQVQTTETSQPAASNYTFRNNKLLKDHYYKHGRYMGFDSAEEYQAAANAVISNPDALTKTEKEDGDYLFYVEDTNEFVVLSTEGYIRTYFCPDSGKRYFDKQ